MDAGTAAYGLLILLLVGTAYLIIKLVAGEDRYSKMTEREFEDEAKRVSMTAVGLLEVQKHLDPSHRVEYMLQQDKHVEAEDADSGDKPPEEPPSTSPQKQ